MYKEKIFTQQEVYKAAEGSHPSCYETAITGLMKIIGFSSEKIDRRENKLKHKRGLYILAHEPLDNEIRYFQNDDGDRQMISGSWSAIDEGVRDVPECLKELARKYNKPQENREFEEYHQLSFNFE